MPCYLVTLYCTILLYKAANVIGTYRAIWLLTDRTRTNEHKDQKVFNKSYHEYLITLVPFLFPFYSLPTFRNIHLLRCIRQPCKTVHEKWVGLALNYHLNCLSWKGWYHVHLFTDVWFLFSKKIHYLSFNISFLQNQHVYGILYSTSSDWQSTNTVLKNYTVCIYWGHY